MSKSRPNCTSLDIARAAGTSRATVSRVLNGTNGHIAISEETRARVLRVAAEMGYAPNAAARQLRMRRAQAIGLILPPSRYRRPGQPGTFGLAQFLGGIIDAGDSTEYNIMLAPGTSPERAVQMLHGKQVDGLLVIHPLETDPYIRGLLAAGAPVVSMCQMPAEVPVSWVDFDNVGGARAAVLHLAQRGHRRIAFICGMAGTMVSSLRIRGYREALDLAGICFQEDLVVSAPEPTRTPQGAAALRQLLRLPEPPTAVFCYRDQLAFGVLLAAREAGLRVPQDLAVVGFDDDPASAHQDPPLTTVRADFFGAGREAAMLLIDLIEERTPGPASKLLPTELIVRGST